MKRLLLTLFVLLLPASVEAQLRPAAFTTVTITNTSNSLLVGCVVGTTACTGSIKTGSIVVHTATNKNLASSVGVNAGGIALNCVNDANNANVPCEFRGTSLWFTPTGAANQNLVISNAIAISGAVGISCTNDAGNANVPCEVRGSTLTLNSISGPITLSGTTTTTGSANVTGDLNVTTNTAMTGTLTVTGATAVGGAFTVNNTINANADVRVTTSTDSAYSGGPPGVQAPYTMGITGSIMRMNESAALEIGRITNAAGDPGVFFVMVNVATDSVTLKNAYGGFGQLLCTTGADIVLTTNKAALIWYDAAAFAYRAGPLF